MQLLNFRKPLIFLVLLFVVFTASHAQDNMQEQFDEFYQTQTSSWQEYKLVKVPRLKNFWAIVSDSIKVKEEKIITARAKVTTLNAELDRINEELQQTQLNLSASEELNDSISFVGIQMSKASYNALVWLIIAGLVLGIVSLYLMYLRNHKITRDARMNLIKVEEEYTAHQEKARENQSKLKRELQTALNTLQEHRIKM